MRNFTKEEKATIYREWLFKRKYEDIAKEFRSNVSDISEVIEKINSKVAIPEDSINILENMHIIEPITALQLTEEGKNYVARDLATNLEKIEIIADSKVFELVSSINNILPGIKAVITNEKEKPDMAFTKELKDNLVKVRSDLQNILDNLESISQKQTEPTGITHNIPWEEDYSQRKIRKFVRERARIEGQRKEVNVESYPKAGVVGQILKDIEFPADKNKIIEHIKQKHSSVQNKGEILAKLRKMEDREYKNVSDVTTEAGAY